MRSLQANKVNQDDDEINRQLELLLVDHFWSVLISHLIMIAANTYYYWAQVSNNVLAVWCVLMICITLSRCYCLVLYNRFRDHPVKFNLCKQAHFFLVIVVGLGWTFLFSYTVTHLGLFGVLLSFLSLSGIAGGAVSTLTASYKTYQAFIVCLMPLNCITVFLLGEFEGIAIGIVSLMYASVLLNSGGKVHAVLRDNLVMRLNLAREKEHAESLAAELQVLSTIDSLTGIPNRRVFDESMKKAWEYSGQQGLPLAMILCDIDYFKPYNDKLGHQKGDDCLQQIAILLRTFAHKKTDLVSRVGGEEFAFILPNTNQAEASELAAEVCHYVHSRCIPHPSSEVSEYVTISMGVAEKENLDASCKDFIKRADDALYQAKSAGRNCVFPPPDRPIHYRFSS